ncbi:MAG TPA: HAD family phosphatase [Acidimicrobiales bacterium]
MPAIDTVVFDVGGVLLDWDPRHLYRKVFADEAAVERFLAETGLLDWHVREHDRGGRWPRRSPRWSDASPPTPRRSASGRGGSWRTSAASSTGTVALLAELRGRARLLALSNWPAETATELRATYEFFGWFDGVVISGEERVAKPDPRLFRLLCERHAVDPATSLFADDVPANATAAEALGFNVHVFRSPEQLRIDLERLGLLPGPAPAPQG